jgi:hypothetical protein
VAIVSVLSVGRWQSATAMAKKEKKGGHCQLLDHLVGAGD